MASENDRVAAHGPDDDESIEASGTDTELAALQDILLGNTAGRLDAIETRLDDPELLAEEVGAVLPQVLRDHAHDPALARALTAPLEEAVTASVRRNPAPLADALFPVMGPAIRRAVAANLTALIESFNRTLEHAVSWRSIRWRLEALRTHRSFAEVVLLKTLLYRVEQVFLIDRASGVLLLHVQPGSATVADADMVSGMLTAIRDFVGDSFHVGESDSLEALKVGDLSVWIEPGPHAVLAAVVRGTAPADFRARLQDAIETVHLQQGADLEHFAGDTSVFERARPALETCLTSEYRAEERARPALALWTLVGALLLVLLVWGGLSLRDRARQARYLDALGAEPGLTVISAERRAGRLVLSGLRDPLSRDPMALLSGTGLVPEEVDATWAPYQALDPSFVLMRAREILRPPDGAALTLTDGVLLVAGSAPAAWIVDARRLAPLIGGVTRLDVDASVTSAAIARVEAGTLLFVTGSSGFVPGQDDERERLLASFGELDALAAATDTRFGVTIIGHTDAEGTEASNLTLSQRRAEAVRELLPLTSLSHLDITTTGVGSHEPAATGGDPGSRQRNRRVTVRVSPAG